MTEFVDRTQKLHTTTVGIISGKPSVDKRRQIAWVIPMRQDGSWQGVLTPSYVLGQTFHMCSHALFKPSENRLERFSDSWACVTQQNKPRDNEGDLRHNRQK